MSLNYPPYTARDTVTGTDKIWQVTPLFSKPLSMSIIDDKMTGDIFRMFKKLSDDKTRWIEDNEDSGTNGAVTINKDVLSFDPDLKKYLTEMSLGCLKGVLGHDTDVQITTSWFTKTRENGSCIAHIHQNSWYSAVVYFGEYYDGSSPLQFNGTYDQISPMNVVEPNFFNSNTWLVRPKRGLMVLFPSNLSHEVLQSGNVQERYSLAFNLMPHGPSGMGDSAYVYQ